MHEHTLLHTSYREAALLKKTYIHIYKLQRGYINKHFKQPYTQLYTHTHIHKNTYKYIIFMQKLRALT